MALPTVTTLYCSDEDLAIRAPGDFASLAAKGATIVSGGDGTFATGAAWTWVLTAGVSLQALGLAPGHVVQLSDGTITGSGAALFSANTVALYGVTSVTGATATLKQIGLAAGIGQPPGPPAGASAVGYAANTLSPQITLASYDINRRFNINDLISTRETAMLVDLNEVQEVTELTVLWKLCEAAAKDAGAKDHFAAQAERFRRDYNDLIERASVHWKTPQIVEETRPMFGTRLIR